MNVNEAIVELKKGNCVEFNSDVEGDCVARYQDDSAIWIEVTLENKAFKHVNSEIFRRFYKESEFKLQDKTMDVKDSYCSLETLNKANEEINQLKAVNAEHQKLVAEQAKEIERLKRGKKELRIRNKNQEKMVNGIARERDELSNLNTSLRATIESQDKEIASLQGFIEDSNSIRVRLVHKLKSATVECNNWKRQFCEVMKNETAN